MRVLLADDHPLFREGVKPVLARLEEGVELIEATDFPTAFEAMHQANALDGGVDLALLDLYMPGMDGMAGVAGFRTTFPEVPLVVLSAAEERDQIETLLGAGAMGYITKSSPSEVILSALRLVLAGGVYVPPTLLDHAPHAQYPHAAPVHTRLTARQANIMRELAKGLSNREIADVLHITEGTVKVHLASIFKLLGVTNRTEALLTAQKMGLR